MTPTFLEIAVAILLLWVAWRVGVLITPWVLSRFRLRYPPRAKRNAPEQPRQTPRLSNKE